MEWGKLLYSGQGEVYNVGNDSGEEQEMVNLIDITGLDIPELHMYVGASEVQLLRYFEPGPGVFVAESPNVILRALDAGYEPLSLLLEKKQVEGAAREVLARCVQVPVYVAEEEVLKKLTGFEMTRGVLCAMRRKVMPAMEEICAGAKRIVVLESVMNPTNVGAIFRSAAALGMDGILLTEGCADPLYRRAARVSMGTVFQIPWTYMNKHTCTCTESTGEKCNERWQGMGAMKREDVWPALAMEKLRKMDFRTVAMALTEISVGIDHPALQAEEKLAIVLGTEGDGLASSTIANCDYTVKIPMAHGVDSLNVAAASAVAFWQLGKR